MNPYPAIQVLTMAVRKIIFSRINCGRKDIGEMGLSEFISVYRYPCADSNIIC